MKPIPKWLLIHKAVLHKVESEDRFGKTALDDGIQLDRVRFEPTDRIVRDSNKSEIKLSAILFYDCKNSKPRGTTFAVDDIITFNQKQYKVQVCDLLEDKKPHHYELGLVGHA